MRGTQVERLLLPEGYNTVLCPGYYIDLMLSVDSHYQRSITQEHCSFSGRKGANTGREAAMWSGTCGALNIDSKYGPELPQL
jgi:hexosaminidase